jgi:Ca2+-binding RTX toxin-like protein
MNDPRMGTLYSQMASDFSANGGGELVAYQDTGGPSVWGHWGVLDNIYQTSSPRYDALLNFQRNSLSTVTAPAPATTTTTDSMATSASSTVTPTVDPTKIIGTSGSDSLAVGGAYDTTIDALGGNDTLIGGAGKNMLIGGAGDDSYTIVDGDDLVIELSSGGHDKVTSSVDYSLTANVEDLFLVGSAHNGVGNSLANILQGGAGDDMLSGLAGNDILCGGGGNDRLIGGDGNDRLVGGAGADSLAGGAGADIFSFNVGDFTSGSGALDRIEDFSSRRKDRIDFSAMDANPATSVNDSFTFIGKQAFHHVAGEMRYEAIGGSSYVMGDLDGNGVADFQITVVGVTSFRSSDFLF